MKDNAHEHDAPRREPKTKRGQDTRDKIVKAATELLERRWLIDTPFTDVVSEAQVQRASLLHVFPHWRDLLYDIWVREVDQFDLWYAEAKALRHVRPEARAFAMLRKPIDRAEKTGKLYANLRSAMFTWGGEPTFGDFDIDVQEPLTPERIGFFIRIPLQDHYASIEDLLGLRNSEGSTAVGECLFNFAMDLAAASPWQGGPDDYEHRREALRSMIGIVRAGTRRVRNQRR